MNSEMACGDGCCVTDKRRGPLIQPFVAWEEDVNGTPIRAGKPRALKMLRLKW